MSNSGYISLHKKLLSWRWYKNQNVKSLFIHLLLTANYVESEFEGVKIERGQVVIGRNSLSEATGLSVQNVRTALDKLKSTSEITIKSTNKFSVVTICNYNKYQDGTKQTNQQTNHQTNKRLTTSNNINNINKINNNNISGEEPLEKTLNEVNVLLAKFQPVNPSYKSLYANKTQRRAMQDMVDEHGFEKMKKVLDTLPSIVIKPYAPKITTPYELKTMFGKLILFISQGKQNEGSKHAVFNPKKQ